MFIHSFYHTQTEESEEGEIEQEGAEQTLSSTFIPLGLLFVLRFRIDRYHRQVAIEIIVAVAEQRKAEREAAKREVEARKRMLGNIIFVGQLYCRGVLTEKVMHSCIQQLLDEVGIPSMSDQPIG